MAEKSLQARADSGDAAAQVELGSNYESGSGGVRRDLSRAAHYFQMAADQGNPEGCVSYARLLQEGRGVSRNFQAAERYLKIAADAGFAPANRALGELHVKDRDSRVCIQYFRAAAEAGDHEAQFRLAGILEKDPRAGKGRFQEATRLYREAADGGHAGAQAAYGVLLEHGKGTGRNVRGAIRYYRMSADQGHGQGLFQLARMHENGYGMPQNLEQAITLYERAVEAGYQQASLHLAQLLAENGREEEAIEMMRKAADKRNPTAMLQVGRMLEKREPETAARYIKGAADMGNLDAQVRYGQMLCSGIGMQRNDAEAVRVFRAAASKGSADAMFILSSMIKLGRGCDKNEKEAYKMLEMAAKNGQQEAKRIVEALTEKKRSEKQAADAAAEEEARLQRIHAEKSRRKEDEEEQKTRGRGRGGRGGRGGGGRGYIPSQGAPKPAPLTPQQIEEQHRQQAMKQRKEQEQQAMKAVVVEKDTADTKSFVEAKEEQKKHGGPKAQYKLAKHFLEEGSKDLVLAYHFIKLAAERVPEAMMQLSEMLEKGEIGEHLGEPQYEASRHYLHCAVRVNYIPGMLRLSKIYEDGIGVEVDKTESAKWLKMAADTGDGPSQLKVAQMMRAGDVFKENSQLSREYFIKAAKNKVLEAQLELVKELPPEEAVPYLEGAAENKDLESARRIGQMYRDGVTVSVDAHKAKKYLGIASEIGNDDDKRAYEEFIAKTGTAPEASSNV